MINTVSPSAFNYLQPIACDMEPRDSNARLAVLCLSDSLDESGSGSLKYAARMQARGENVTLFTSPATPLTEMATRRGLSFTTLRRFNSLFMPFTALALSRQLKRLQIGVLVVTQREDLALAELANKLLGSQLRIRYQQQ